MVKLSELKFSIEKHPFKGLSMKIMHNNKYLSPYSSGAPQSIRPILRKVLLHKDISAELEAFLESNSEDLQLELKLGRQRISCHWDSTLFFEKKMLIQASGGSIAIEHMCATNDVVMLSDRLCFFSNQQALGRIKEVGSLRSLSDLNTLELPVVAPDKKAVKSSKFTMVAFNQLPLCLSSKEEFDQCYFVNNKEIVSPLVISQQPGVVIYYTENDPLVKIYINYEDSRLDKDDQLFGRLLEYFAFTHDYSDIQKKELITWLISFGKASVDTERCHALPKEIETLIEPEHFCFVKPLVANLNTTVFQAMYSADQWLIVEWYYFLEWYSCLAVCFLFSDKAIYKQSEQCLCIDKQLFHYHCSTLLEILDSVNMPYHYSESELIIRKQSVYVSVKEGAESQWEPSIYIDGQSIDLDGLYQLKTNLWSVLDTKGIAVFDPVMIEQCEKILALTELQKKRQDNHQIPPYQRSLYLLDWIQLRQSGIDIQLDEEQEKQVKSFMSFTSLKQVDIPKSITSKPRPYQSMGLNWMMFLYDHGLGGILADDMGLGKTFQSLMFLASIKEKKINISCKVNDEIIPHLIVVPPSLIYNWTHEIYRFCPDMTVYVYSGSNRQLLNDTDIVITSYDVLRRDYLLFSKKQFDVVIFDEAQFIKNQLSARTQATAYINRNSCFCLTGTPMENHLGEYITILNTALPGFLTLENRDKSLISKQEVDIIIKRSKPFVLRRLKDEINHELQPKTEETVMFSMTESQQKVYDSLVTVAKKEMSQKKSGNMHYFILTTLMRLRQVCVSPQLLDKEMTELAPKFKFLKEKLTVLRDEGHSALVFSQFMESLSIMETICQNESIDYFRLDGSVTAAKRKKMIDTFQTSTQPQVFLISLKAGGFGLNLTKASYVFHLDPWWNPFVENQATDRVHRIGQTQPVFSYKLIMHDSVEEKIQDIKQKKSELFKAVLHDSAIVKKAHQLSPTDFDHLLS